VHIWAPASDLILKTYANSTVGPLPHAASGRACLQL